MEIGDEFDSNDDDIIYGDNALVLPQLAANRAENDEIAAAIADPANWMRHMRKSIGSVRFILEAQTLHFALCLNLVNPTCQDWPTGGRTPNARQTQFSI